MSRDAETDIRVYEGEVEHFVAAQSEGIGIRVIRDGRTGFAYAGTLDEAAVAEVLAEARDNVQFGTPDEWAGLAEPDGVDVVAQELWSEALAEYPTDGKIALAKELERLTLAVDPRIRVDDANYADVAVRVRRGHHHGHPPHRSRERLLRGRQHAGRRRRRDPDRLRVQRRPVTRRVRPRQGRQGGQRSGDPSARRHEAGHEAHHGGARSVRHGQLPRHHLQHAQRRERGQGSQPVQGPPRRERGQLHRHARRRSHQPEGVHRHRPRRRGPRRAAQRADRRRRAAAVRALVVHARGASVRRAPATRFAAGSRARPASAALRCSCCPGTRDRPR